MFRFTALVLALTLTACGPDDGVDGNDDNPNPDDVTDPNGNNDPDDEDPVDEDPVDTRSGLEKSCDAYKECGGTYYATSEDCVEASLNYWGECASRRDALDAFGDCMADVPCEDYNPDAYNPASTVCADEWSDVQSSEACG